MTDIKKIQNEVRILIRMGQYQKQLMKMLEHFHEEGFDISDEEGREIVAENLTKLFRALVTNAIDKTLEVIEPEVARITRLEAALGFAKAAIMAYEGEIAEAIMRGNVSRGFCQGVMFKDVIGTIDKLSTE